MGNWVFHEFGTTGAPERDTLIVEPTDDNGRQRIRLEVSAPGSLSLTGDRKARFRQEVQAALDAIQEALNTPSVLTISRDRNA